METRRGGYSGCNRPGYSLNRRDFLAAAAGIGLAGGMSRIAGAARQALQPVGGLVAGSVLGGGRPLEGVLVSDGCRVVRTGPQGKYVLPTGPDSKPFVFVTTPRGYWTNRFYLPLAQVAKTGRADFALRPMHQPDKFDFTFITDMHLESRLYALTETEASLREIGALAPAFVWAQGDISLQCMLGQEYLDSLKLLKMPVRNGIGNHEMMLTHKDPRDEFYRYFGPSYHSFDWGPLHCIILDGNRPIPGGKGYGTVYGAVEGSELEWLRADLAAQPKHKPIIVGVHIPVVSTYALRHRRLRKPVPYCRTINSAELTDLFAEHRVQLVLQGHMHENERATVRGVEYVESNALSGSWFRSPAGTIERGVDGTPRGYRVVSVDGNKITHRYRTTAESHVDRQGEVVGLTGPLAAANADFVFNCYDAPNGSTATARIDRGAFQSMPSYAPANAEGLERPHHFRLQADLSALKSGSHSLEVRVQWPDGTEVAEQERFEVKAPAILAQRSSPIVHRPIGTTSVP